MEYGGPTELKWSKQESAAMNPPPAPFPPPPHHRPPNNLPWPNPRLAGPTAATVRRGLVLARWGRSPERLPAEMCTLLSNGQFQPSFSSAKCTSRRRSRRPRAPGRLRSGRRCDDGALFDEVRGLGAPPIRLFERAAAGEPFSPERSRDRPGSARWRGRARGAAGRRDPCALPSPRTRSYPPFPHHRADPRP